MTSVPHGKATVGFRFIDAGLLVADANDRIMTIELPNLKQQKQIDPNLPFIKKLYRYLVTPLYLVCPKTAELQNTMQYAITGKDTIKVEAPGLGPNGRTIKLNPWQPMLSNTVFIGVMLLIGCIYVYRQDF